MDFEWDDEKADSNWKKHGVRFSEAATIWRDQNALEVRDPDHSDLEERWIRIGLTSHEKLVVVVYVEKLENELVRIVSARKATKSERNQYLGK